MRFRWYSCLAAATVALALGLSACGGTTDDASVLRIGNEAISKTTVEHWTNVVRHEGAFLAFRGEPQGSAKQRALILLISAHWLIGEAARLGVPVSERTVDAVLAERMSGVGGEEYRARLRKVGQTLADVRLELSAEMALEAIRGEIERRAQRVTQAELVSFYHANPSHFGAPEARLVDIVVGLPSAAAARALVKRIGTGSRFTSMALRKRFVLTTGVQYGPPTKKAVDRAIVAAQPGVVSQPMSYNEGWAVFIVRKVIPAKPKLFAQARPFVLADVVRAHKLAAIAAFEREYRRRWTSSTSCRGGYVAPGCAQYRGPVGTHEDVFALDPFF